MGFGILDDRYLEQVPGTVLLSDQEISKGRQVVINEARDLKMGTGRHAHTILVPQPSDDPGDPLNWPRWKKEACFWTLAFGASLDSALSMAAPGYILLSQHFGVSVDTIASAFGASVVSLACFMLCQNALAAKFGHRIVYLSSVFLTFITCIWCAASPGIASIRASRVMQGFGRSALHSLVPSTIEQIFFVHERGSRSVAWNFSILAGITMGPFIYSYMIESMPWQMGFWFATIPLGLVVLLVFFFVPETTYTRRDTEVILERSKDERDSAMEKRSAVIEEQSPKIFGAHADSHKINYVSQLRIWHGTLTDVSLLKLFLRPLPFLLSPVLWFVFLVFGMQSIWLSLIPICSSTIFTIEYNFTASQIGLTNLGGLVGGVLATVISGPLTDRGTMWLVNYNKGVYEPEFRIVFVSSMLLGVLGYVGWAVGTTRSMPWIGAVACIAMANFSMVMSGSAAITYLLDTHGSNTLHVLAVCSFLKDMVLYGFTFFVNGMVARRGVKTSLLILAGCQAFCWLVSVPMYLFGKRVRSFIHRHPNLFTIGDDSSPRE